MKRILFVSFIVLMSIVSMVGCSSPSSAPKTSDLSSSAPKTSIVRPVYWAIGDSLTGGLYASTEKKSFKWVLADRLIKDAPESCTSVENISAVGGKVTGVADYCRILIQKQKPDLVTIELGINDISGGDITPVESFTKDYNDILDVVTENGTSKRLVVCGTIPWCNWDKGSPKRDIAAKYNGIIKDICAKRGIPVADLWAATVDKPDGISRPNETSTFPPGFKGDNFHPNDTGHQRLSDCFYKIISEHN